MATTLNYNLIVLYNSVNKSGGEFGMRREKFEEKKGKVSLLQFQYLDYLPRLLAVVETEKQGDSPDYLSASPFFKSLARKIISEWRDYFTKEKLRSFFANKLGKY